MLALLKSKGVSGPFLVVASASSLPQWSAKLQQLLPGTLVHTYDAATGSRDALAQLCTPQGKSLMGRTDQPSSCRG